MFTMTTSSGIPPSLSLRRVSEHESLEIMYSNEHDKILAPAVPGSGPTKVGIIRRVQPGEYLLVGAGLGGTDYILHTNKEFQAPLPVTILAHEVNYIGSYRVDLKMLPNADQKTSGNVTVVALSGFNLEYSVTDSMKSDLEALAISKPELSVVNVKNATPEIYKNAN